MFLVAADFISRGRPEDDLMDAISRAWSSSETQGQIVGKTKIKTGGKKFDEQKYERKIRAPGDKLFTYQFQTAERILPPDWAENVFMDAEPIKTL